MPLYSDILDRRIGLNPSTALGYTQDDFPVDFPYARWTAQQVKYNDYWLWFTGTVWEEPIKGAFDKANNPVLKFPLQVNLMKTAAMKHASVLLGEAADGPNPLIPIRVDPKRQVDQDAPDPGLKRQAKELEYFLNDVWMENNGRVLQSEGALIQQFLGGVVYKASWQPFNIDLENGIKVEMILPDFFMPIWDSTNPDDLLETFLVWRISSREAAIRYGYTANGAGPSPDFVLYVEHWTKDTISITLGGRPIEYVVKFQNETGEPTQAAKVFDNEANPFGFIPMVYIPRERAGGYYGLSIIDDLKGLAKEINARMADIGDSVADASHRQLFVRNIAGSIRTRDIGENRNALDLGQQAPGADKPDMVAIEPPKLSDGLVNYPEILRKQFLRDAFLSSVAEGEDEGSQRSALTLAFRMWPLTSKAHITRSYWETALIRLNKMIARMAIFHRVGGITEAHLKGVAFHIDWPPMIPRDREQLVNEVTLLLNSNALSPYSALNVLQMVPDPSEEIDRVKEWLDYQSQLAMQQEAAKQKVKTASQQPVASTGYDNH